MFVTNEPEQPKNWLFVDELKAPRHEKLTWGRSRKKKNEAGLGKGVALDFRFPDGGKVLDTAIADFHAFLKAAGIPESGPFKITVEKKEMGKPFESYRMETEAGSCTISASDTEGIRRALYFLQDEIKRCDGPFLPIGTTAREPMIKTRVSRCFFGPIKRPPLNRDELADDVDYYPEEYLNRLAYEGINGLWLTVGFRDVCPSELFPGQGKDSVKRLAKLRKTAVKCARYGIKIYVFCIEPEGFGKDPEYLKSMSYLEANPEFKGHDANGWEASYFCPSTGKAKKYLEDSAYHIFSNVPELGGLIDINLGERPTHCYSATDNFFGCNCPRCSKRQPWEVFADVTSSLSKGMRRANPQAEMISWLYTPYMFEDKGKSIENHFQVMRDIAAHVPENVTLQVNFESNGKVMQLGRERTALDYWLAWPGPSEIFKDCARAAVKSGTRMSAKIQVGCSHEVATVPFIPVPGNLHKKYSAMRDLGVSSVMQCWYFGNYPGLMNKAAGELSFFPFPDDGDDFLFSLAKIDWGKNAAKVSCAWKLFQKSYSEFPVNLSFTWYGPVHHSVVWPLYLIPVDQPISPSWKFTFPMVSGDRIGECICSGHTLGEVLTLLRRMDKFWTAGVKIMESVEAANQNNPQRLRDISLDKALGLQINSSLNVFTFYALREKLPFMKKAAQIKSLAKMRDIVENEIENSLKLKKLCENDPRLGFHSEAEGYKYFAEKLEWRAGLLRDLITTDFPKVQKIIEDGETLFPDYTGARPEGKVCVCPKNKAKAETHKISEGASFKAWHDDKNVFFSIRLDSSESDFTEAELCIEPRRLWPTHNYQIDSKGELWHFPKGVVDIDKRWTAKISAYMGEKTVDFTVPLACFRKNPESDRPFRFNLTIKKADGHETSWVKKHPFESRLTFGTENPADLAWMLLA
ncbi:MAG: hypothetical protein NT118_02935 [Lentisphaerae bacterium]|nr:hypothetical protein [Lentisphaerota bacterium]